MKSEKRIILTKDGSHTLYIDSLNEYYHSRYGAIQESNHVFISNGLELIDNKEIEVLEVGFGTGLNALLTFIAAKKDQKNIHYDAIELFPLENSLVDKLNFTTFLDTVNHEFLMSLHKLQWNQVHKLNDFFILHKMLKDYNHFIPEKQYHVIYFDAFAPEKQPEMWNEQNFKKLFYALQTNGLMVTYCAKGEIKRRLKKIGFTVKLVEGPPGKHEMIRAVKPG